MHINEQYKFVLKDVIVELGLTQDILKRIETEGFHEGVNNIITQYEDLFAINHEKYGNLIYDHIRFTLGSVGKSTLFYSSEQNTSKHITLEIVSDKAFMIDEIYSNGITDFIQFFKHLFSTLNNYEIYRDPSKLNKFHSFINDIKKNIEYFITINEKSEKKQSEEFLKIKKIEKEEDKLIQKGIFVKSNYEQYSSLIKENDIKCLYHFTARNNLALIRKEGGLYSWPYFSVKEKKNTPGGHDESRCKDAQKGYEDYVRLSFCENHPMRFNRDNKKRVGEYILLKIRPELLYHLGTRYSNKNAIRDDVEISNSIEMLKSFDFNLFKRNYRGLQNLKQKDLYQAEILIRHHIPSEYIMNLDEF